MPAKILFSTDALRDLIGLGGEGSESTSKQARWYNVAISTIGATVSGFFLSGKGLRLNLAERLLTNKEFADGYATKLAADGVENAGRVISSVRTEAAAYVKAKFSDDDFKDMFKNSVNNIKIQWGKASALKELGLNWRQLWSGQSSLRKVSLIAGAVLAVGYLVDAVVKLVKSPKQEEARHDPMEHTPSRAVKVEADAPSSTPEEKQWTMTRQKAENHTTGIHQSRQQTATAELA